MIQRLGAVEMVATLRLELETKFKLQHKLLNMMYVMTNYIFWRGIALSQR